MRKNLLSLSRVLYSQVQKKNIFVLPKKHEIRAECLTETQVAIRRARSCAILAASLKENIHWFTEFHIQQLYSHLRTFNLEIDDTFHSVIAPISLQYIKCFNREQSMILYQMIMTILQLRIDNQQLWDAIIKKLDDENYYKYITLFEAGQLLNQLLNHKDLHSLPLTKKLIGVVYQQNKFYMSFPQPTKVVKEILGKMENYQGSELQLTQAFKQLE